MPDENNRQSATPEVAPTEAPDTPTPAAVPTSDTPAAAPTQETPPASSAPAPDAPPAPSAPPTQEMMPAFDPAPWDKQKVKVGKKFFSAISPRLFGNPFSFDIDKVRAKKAAEAKGFQMVDKGMVLLTPGKFMGQLMIEVSGGAEGDISVLKIEEVYSKVSERGWGGIDKDIAEAEKELGQKAKAVYLWKADSKHIVIFAVV